MYHRLTKDTTLKAIRPHLIFSLIIISLTFSVYLNVLHGDTQFDDERYIFEYKSPRSLVNTNFWDSLISGFRPVTNFTFSLNYYFWGQDTFSYHLTNLIIHMVNGLLVYILIYITLQGVKRQGESRKGVMNHAPTPLNKGHWTAFLTALLFSIHPIQTESVSYICQRAESLSSMFYLFSLITFISAARQLNAMSLKSDAKDINFRIITSVALYIIFVLGFIMAWWSKEIAATLPVMAILYGIYFFENEGRWKKLAVPALLIITALVMTVAKLAKIPQQSTVGFNMKEFSGMDYLYTQFSVIVQYLKLLILPVGQNIEHFYPVSRSFTETRTAASFSLLVILFIASLWLFRKWKTGSFFILWFFIILLPTSSIFPIKDVFVEHRLYLPSLGIFFLLASGVTILVERSRKTIFFYPALLSLFIVICILCGATYNRNRIWNSRLAMWEDAVTKSPQSARAWHNLGNCYQLENDYKKALKAFLTSWDLALPSMELYFDIGLCLEKMGMKNLAKDFFIVFVRYAPESYAVEKKAIAFKYDITENTALPCRNFKTLIETGLKSPDGIKDRQRGLYAE